MTGDKPCAVCGATEIYGPPLGDMRHGDKRIRLYQCHYQRGTFRCENTRAVDIDKRYRIESEELLKQFRENGLC